MTLALTNTHPAEAPIPMPSTPIGDHAAAFLDFIEVFDSTRDKYGRVLLGYVQWLTENGRSGYDPLDYAAWRDHLAGIVKASSARTYLAVVRTFYSWMQARGLWTNIAEGIKPPKAAKGFGHDVLTEAQIAEVLAAMPRESVIDARNYAIVNLMARTGLRGIEVSRLTIEDFGTLDGANIIRVWGKGRIEADDFVVLTSKALGPLMDYLALTGRDLFSTGPLFLSADRASGSHALSTVTIRKIVKSAFLAVGLDSDRLTAHSLRGSFITALLKHGATLQEVRACARHSSLDMVLRYAQNLDRAAGPEDLLQF